MATSTENALESGELPINSAWKRKDYDDLLSLLQQDSLFPENFNLDELSEEDKLVVARARRIRNFFSQPFHVAEKFSGVKGIYVPVSKTIAGFKAILEGKCDNWPEQAFLYVGSIEEAQKKANTLG